MMAETAGGETMPAGYQLEVRTLFPLLVPVSYAPDLIWGGPY